MNDSQYTEEDFIMVGKYLSGEATPEEAIALEDWMKLPGNQEKFDAIMNTWNKTSTNPYHPVRASESWKKWKYPHATVKTVGMRKWILAASVVAAIFTLGIIWLIVSKEHNVVMGSATATVRDILPDNTSLFIPKNSYVEYTSTFNQQSREVTLKGEASFEVTHDERRPFIITIDNMKIKVVGTSFYVKKIRADSTIEVDVITGIVKMYTDTKELLVKAHQKGVYHEAIDSFSLEQEPDLFNISKVKKSFSFNDMSLAAIKAELEKAFNVTINLERSALEQCRMTANFDNETLAYILDVISVTLNVRCKTQGNTIIIYGDGCN